MSGPIIRASCLRADRAAPDRGCESQVCSQVVIECLRTQAITTAPRSARHRPGAGQFLDKMQTRSRNPLSHRL